MDARAHIARNTFQVAEPCSVTVEITGNEDIAVGDAVECQFPNSWSLISGPSFTREFQAEDPAKEHYISAEAPNSGCIFNISIHPSHLFMPERSGRHGRRIRVEAVSGNVPAGEPVFLTYANTYAPYVAETETLRIWVKGCPLEHDPHLIVTPAPADSMRIIAPSTAQPGTEFDVMIVSLDRFDNLSSSSFTGKTLFTLDGLPVKRHLTFTGGIRVPVSVSEEGVYRFKMDSTVSNAVLVRASGPELFWGDIHIHTKVSSDAQGTDPYSYARNVSGLDFAAAADHCESLGDAGYEQLTSWTEKANEPGTFVALFADERNPERATGHHNMYFRTREAMDEYRVQYIGDSKHTDRREGEIDSMPPEDVMLIPHHTGIGWRKMPEKGIGSAVDWDALGDNGLRPVMEIYSHHGQSDMYCPQHILSYEFNRMRKPGRRSNISIPGPYYAQNYLMMGKKIGFIGSSDEHSGQGGRRHGGVAAVFGGELTRDALFSSIRERRCYATTGERIILEFSVNGKPMGSVNRFKKDTELNISLKVWGTDILVQVEILRFRFGQDEAFTPVLAESPRPEVLDGVFDVTDTLRTDTVYYARTVQEPLEWPGMAWSSPVWVEVNNME